MTGTDLIPAGVEDVADIEVTPALATRWMLYVGRQLRDAAEEVEATRKVELEAERVYLKAHRRVILSAECPVVGRGPGEWTVAARDAWVSDRVAVEEFAYADAKAAREGAERAVRRLNEQINLVMGIASVVKAELRGGVR